MADAGNFSPTWEGSLTPWGVLVLPVHHLEPNWGPWMWAGRHTWSTAKRALASEAWLSTAEEVCSLLEFVFPGHDETTPRLDTEAQMPAQIGQLAVRWLCWEVWVGQVAPPQVPAHVGAGLLDRQSFPEMLHTWKSRGGSF